MEDDKYTELYADICNIVDRALCEVSVFKIDPKLPKDLLFTSPEARDCANKLIKCLKEKYGFKFPDDSAAQNHLRKHWKGILKYLLKTQES